MSEEKARKSDKTYIMAIPCNDEGMLLGSQDNQRKSEVIQAVKQQVIENKKKN